MDFHCTNLEAWREAIASYPTKLESLRKPDLVHIDDFYRNELPDVLRRRKPNPYLTKSELLTVMQWKLSRGKWRPRLLDYVSSLSEIQVEMASLRAFESLPDISKAVCELTALRGVGPATASAILAAYAPETAPFMSDEAIDAAIGGKKDYSLKQYLILVEKLQRKAKEISVPGTVLTPSDIERALWSAAVGVKILASEVNVSKKLSPKNAKRKR